MRTASFLKEHDVSPAVAVNALISVLPWGVYDPKENVEMSIEQRLANLGISPDLPEEEIAARLKALQEKFLAEQRAALEEYQRELDERKPQRE
jgi:translation elongation factor EF-1beta